MNIALVANEPSGDLLGASIIRQIRNREPGARFTGVGGPRMIAEGCQTLLDQERLARMGLVEVVGHLPELLRIRRRLGNHFLRHPPDVLVTIDAPDFNLGLAERLHRHGIRTVHVVSPTVWAWRPGRVRILRRSLDLLLSLFPFEEAFLRAHGVPVRSIGHPLADEIPQDVDPAVGRRALGFSQKDPLIALLPGSRMGEVRALAKPMIETALWCRQRKPRLQFGVPLVSPRIRALFEEILRKTAPSLPIRCFDGESRTLIGAADAVLTASGTATLETLLLKKPMVVAYRIHPLTYHLIRGLGLVKVPYIAMANLLADAELAPEFLQTRCEAHRMGPPLLAFLDDPERVAAIRAIYGNIHRTLRRQASDRAALAILNLVRENTHGR